MLLDATLQELAEVGWGGFSFESVALRAGVNKTTLYRRWPTKAHLVRAALSSQATRIFAAPNTGNVREDLLLLCQSACAFMTTANGRCQMLALLTQDVDPAVLDMLYEIRHSEESKPYQIIKLAIARKELSPHTDIPLLLDALLGALLRRTLLERREMDEASLRKLIDLVLIGSQQMLLLSFSYSWP